MDWTGSEMSAVCCQAVLCGISVGCVTSYTPRTKLSRPVVRNGADGLDGVGDVGGVLPEAVLCQAVLCPAVLRGSTVIMASMPEEGIFGPMMIYRHTTPSA
jgi:hypothetical protein